LKTTTFLLLFLFIITSGSLLAQNATIKGVVLDENNTPISGVSVTTNDNGTETNFDGFFLLEVPVNQEIVLVFSHISFKNILIPIP